MPLTQKRPGLTHGGVHISPPRVIKCRSTVSGTSRKARQANDFMPFSIVPSLGCPIFDLSTDRMTAHQTQPGRVMFEGCAEGQASGSRRRGASQRRSGTDRERRQSPPMARDKHNTPRAIPRASPKEGPALALSAPRPSVSVTLGVPEHSTITATDRDTSNPNEADGTRTQPRLAPRDSSPRTRRIPPLNAARCGNPHTKCLGHMEPTRLLHFDPPPREEAVDRVAGVGIVRHELPHLHVRVAARVVEQGGDATVPGGGQSCTGVFRGYGGTTSWRTGEGGRGGGTGPIKERH